MALEYIDGMAFFSRPHCNISILVCCDNFTISLTPYQASTTRPSLEMRYLTSKSLRSWFIYFKNWKTAVDCTSY